MPREPLGRELRATSESREGTKTARRAQAHEVEARHRRLETGVQVGGTAGSDEAVELQVLQLLEMRALAIRPEVVKARRRPILDPYVGFLRRKFPEAPTMNLAALLEQGGRRGELAAILGEFRNEMVAAIEATRRSVAAPSRSFAMWIESAAWNDVGQRALIVNGSCLGSAPEPGIPLLVEPAFGSPLRAHAADVVEAREGAPRSALMLAGLPAIEADVVGAQARPEASDIEEVCIEARDLEPQGPRVFIPIERKIAVELRHPLDFLFYGRSAGGLWVRLPVETPRHRQRETNQDGHFRAHVPLSLKRAAMRKRP